MIRCAASVCLSHLLLLLLDELHVRVRVGALDDEREREGRAEAVLGLDPDLPAHQLDELLADGEAEPDAERVAHARVLDLHEHA